MLFFPSARTTFATSLTGMNPSFPPNPIKDPVQFTQSILILCRLHDGFCSGPGRGSKLQACKGAPGSARRAHCCCTACQDLYAWALRWPLMMCGVGVYDVYYTFYERTEP